MEQIEFVKSGLITSRIGLGTRAIGGWMWGGTDEAQSIATIRSAIDRGSPHWLRHSCLLLLAPRRQARLGRRRGFSHPASNITTDGPIRTARSGTAICPVRPAATITA